MKIIGESPHEWPQTSLSNVAHTSLYFLHDFRVLKKQINRWKLPSIDRRSIAVVLWRHTNTYYDVILTDCHKNVYKWVTCVFPSSSSYHALIIENYSQHVRWLARNKPILITTSNGPIRLHSMVWQKVSAVYHGVCSKSYDIKVPLNSVIHHKIIVLRHISRPTFIQFLSYSCLDSPSTTITCIYEVLLVSFA